MATLQWCVDITNEVLKRYAKANGISVDELLRRLLAGDEALKDEIRGWMFAYMLELINKPASELTDAQVAYLGWMAKKAHDYEVKVAHDAVDMYYAWKGDPGGWVGPNGEKGSTPTKLGGLFSTPNPPPDGFLTISQRANLGGVGGKKGAAIAAGVGAAAVVIGAAGVTAGFVATTSALGAGVGIFLAGSGSTAVGLSAAVLLGPIAIVVGALIVGGLELANVLKKGKIEQNLLTNLDNARNKPPPDLKNMTSNGAGTVTLLAMFMSGLGV